MIGEEEVKDILRNYEKKILMIRGKMESLYREIQSTDAAISEASFPCTKYGTLGRNSMHKDLSDVLQRCEGIYMERNKEIRSLMYELSGEDERIRRVWACFHILDDPYFQILDELYVKNKLYQTAEAESGYSHKTFEKYRSEAVRLVIFLYECGGSITDLTHRYKKMMKGRRKPRLKRQEPSQGGCRQLTLFDGLPPGPWEESRSPAGKEGEGRKDGRE